MNAAEIENLLLGRAQDVVLHLFPNAKIKGGEAFLGDLYGTPGESLKIRVSGSKTGHWGDFSGSEKGKKLIGLWHAARGHASFHKTLQEAAEWLGVGQTTQKTFYAAQKPTVAKCQPPADVSPAAAGSVFRYLTEERGLTPKTLEDYGVHQNDADTAVFFPFLTHDGRELQMGKFLALERPDGKKKVWTKGDAKVLFGKPAVPATGGDLVITEGEIDAMSCFQMGFPAVSVPFGAKEDGANGNPNDEWIRNDYEWLECFTRIYLVFDADGPGQRAAASIASRLGRERCYLVEMPDGCKDANEVLTKDRAADLFEAIHSARSLDPAELKTAAQFKDAVWDLFSPKGEAQIGIPFFLEMPWRLRVAEVSIWTGHSGHGKSEVLNQLMVYLRSVGQRVCVASFEVKPQNTLRNMTLQAVGLQISQNDREVFSAAFDWLAEGVWVVDRVGKFHWKQLLDIIRYARRRYNVRHFVIDSLLRCGIPDDDYNQQKDFVDALTILALEEEIHIHLVAHARKSEDESRAPGKMDVSGSSNITHLGHNCLTVYRNKAKEEKIQDLKAEGRPSVPELDRVPDGYIKMTKQRETGEEPKCAFFFLAGIRQFVSRFNSPAAHYFHGSGHAE